MRGDDGSPAVKVLTALGVSRSAVEAETVKILGDPLAEEGGRFTASVQINAVTDNVKTNTANTPSGIPLPGSVWNYDTTLADSLKTADDMKGTEPYNPDEIRIEGKFTPFDPMLHRVRGRDYTETALKATLAAAAQVLTLDTAVGDGLIGAAEAFLTEMFGGPAPAPEAR